VQNQRGGGQERRWGKKKSNSLIANQGKKKGKLLSGERGFQAGTRKRKYLREKQNEGEKEKRNCGKTVVSRGGGEKKKKKKKKKKKRKLPGWGTKRTEQIPDQRRLKRNSVILPHPKVKGEKNDHTRALRRRNRSKNLKGIPRRGAR